MSLEEILADVKQEGEILNDDKETVTPSDSPAEKESKVVEPVQGDNTDPYANRPFHEHPRWKEREAKLQELESFRQEAQAELEQLRSQRTVSQPTVPQWFAEMYGDNPQLWQNYQESERERKEEIKRELREEQEEETMAAEKESAHWTNWVSQQLDNLPGLDVKDRDELVGLMLKYRPTDEDNNLDFQAGLELLKLARTQRTAVDKTKVEVKKKVAGLATDKSVGEGQRKDYLTSQDLRNASWNSL